jgi:hypothetical protein
MAVQRFVTAIEVTFWLVLLLLLGTVHPPQHSLGGSTIRYRATAMVQPQSSAPQYLRRQRLPHRPTVEWSLTDRFQK